MRVWIYTRLSNDDDPERDSLQNQERICREFAVQRGDHIAGLSSDDNISGMNFSRRGLSRLTAAVEAGGLDGVVVKDLSRLGRHRTQTALFIDYLRERDVRVLSATEGLDTFREEDDLIIGVRGLMNDYYAKDIGRKIRAGYHQKQKEGIVIIPSFGYWKDKNTGEIKVIEEAAETVRMVYSLYLGGVRLKEIARRLNERERKTPAQLQYERYGKRRQDIHKAKDGSYVWTYTSVKNILTDESYVGVLTNHRKQMREGKTYAVPEAEQFRHEGVYPVIIQREDWGRVQELLNQNARKHPAPGNKARHRYAGLLACAECGNPFVPMIRYWRGNSRVEYVCKGYQRNGKTYCASHRIHEETLDARVWELVSTARESRAEELKKLAQMQKMWALRKPILDAHISALQKKVQELEREIDEIVIEKLKGSVSNPRPR